MIRVSITTADGEVLDLLEIHGDESGANLPDSEMARKVADHIGDRFMLESE